MGCKREEGNVHKIIAGPNFLEKSSWKTWKQVGHCEGK